MCTESKKKTCKKCGVVKDIEAFRLHREPRSAGGNCFYRVGACKECEAKAARAYHDKVKDIPGYKAKHAAYAIARYWRRRDEMIQKQREARKTERHKKNRRKYIAEHREKIFAQETITKKRYHEKHRDNLTDIYICRLFLNHGLPEPSPAQIERKRSQILIERIRKITKKHKIGIWRVCYICGDKKDLSEFYEYTGKTGRRLRKTVCITCDNKRSREYNIKRRSKQGTNGKKNTK